MYVIDNNFGFLDKIEINVSIDASFVRLTLAYKLADVSFTRSKTVLRGGLHSADKQLSNVNLPCQMSGAICIYKLTSN